MTTAGELRHRIGFFRRAATDDGYGNVETAYPADPEFARAGKVQAKFGGETVLAQRLQGQQTFTITVRQDALTRTVTTDWMAKDMRLGTIWNIRSGPVDPEDDGAWFEFLCQSGVAT
ncbi:MAG: head-tail adaptor protein [Bryobacteraceae bacterium]